MRVGQHNPIMSTPFDADSATRLVTRVGVSTLKVGSGDLTNAPLLLHLARFQLPIILSTGMADKLLQVEQKQNVDSDRMCRETTVQPKSSDFADVLLDRDSWTELRSEVTLPRCTTEYPADPQSIDLLALTTWSNAFGRTRSSTGSWPRHSYRGSSRCAQRLYSSRST